MIENIKIHDRFSFEIKFGYKTSYSSNESTYLVNTYIFIPHALDINRRTYQKEDFYKDLKSYIRFIPPIYLLRNFLAGENSPFLVLENAMNKLSVDPSPANIEEYKFTLKMFCCILKNAARDEVSYINESESKDDINFLAPNFIIYLDKILVKYRKMRHLISAPTIKKELFSIYSFGDEYLSNVLHKYAHRLMNSLHTKAIGNYNELADRIMQMIKNEIIYREQQAFPLVGEDSIKNEDFVYRRSVLKKFIENELFLHTFVKKDRLFLQQLIYSLAAGIAMVFATTVAFYSQKWYGNMTVHFSIILVISYMLKDRIKELVRYYFTGKMSKFSFDHRSKIFSDNAQEIGYCRESFDFMEENKIPQEILRQRNKEHITKIENDKMGEKILFYRKQINIFPELIQKVYYNFEMQGIDDITQINISKFIAKMDDPQVPLYIPQGDGFKFTLAERIYHLNMIIHYKQNSQDYYHRYRIVLNRDGIKRIQSIEKID